MNKKELETIVDRIFISFNQRLPAVEGERQRVLRAWWRILSDLDPDVVETAVDDLVMTETFLPTPGAVRRKSIMRGSQPPPAALEAWATLQTVAHASESGQFLEVNIHPCLRETINRLGGTASYGMRTNGDRASFIHVYDAVVEEWTMKLLKIGKETTES